MEVKAAIRGRRSIRDFRPEPVPRELLETILQAAIHAPSNSNRQPWEYLVITGARLEELKSALAQAMKQGVSPGRELKTWDEAWPMPAEGNRRAGELMAGLVESAGKAGIKPAEFVSGNFRFFNAPCVILVLMDKGYGYGALVSVGAGIENLLLCAYDLGLGSCWMMMPLQYGEVFRRRFGAPESSYLVSVIALGYPTDSEINRFKSSRDSLEKVAKYYP